MRFNIVLLCPEESRCEFLASTDDLQKAERMVKAINTVSEELGGEAALVKQVKLSPAKPGRPSRKVQVVESTNPEVPPGTVFESARDAAFALGYHYNTVSTMFSTAAWNGKQNITLRGVTLEKI